MAQKSHILKYLETIIAIILLAATMYINDYISFLFIGIICTLLMIRHKVALLRGEIDNTSTPQEELEEIRDITKDKSGILVTAVITGLFMGTVLYSLKKLLVSMF